jgi:uncharacterized membrane-anchored protein YitT (DUF2179 family)
MLQAGHILTGGTVGLSLLLTKYIHLSMSVIYDLVTIPFFILAIWKKGFNFAARSFINVIVVSYFAGQMPHYLHFTVSNHFAAAILANTILGIGVLAIFRHHSSLGGFNVVALIAQENFKIKAGYMQAAMDFCVIAGGYHLYGLKMSLCSLAGVVVLNGILALNHRQDRYVGHSKPVSA